MARKAAAIRGTDESEIRKNERSIPGNCGRMRCSASPTEARYNTLFRNVLRTTPPPRTTKRHEDPPREDSRFGK
jgi:hypothetical protein